MKHTLARKLFGSLFARQFYTAANEATAPVEVVAVNEQAYDVGSQGVMVVPFGEVPVTVCINGRKMRGLQRIDAEAGNAMSADMNGVMGKLRGGLLGRPIFAGHPYHPDASEAAKFTDKRARGFIKSVEVANDSIRLIPKYNSLGQREVEDQQLIYHSPQWRMVPVMAANGVQEIKDGMPVFRPNSLHSGGLTNAPNIDVPPLMTSNEAGAAPAAMDVNKLIAALVDAGVIQTGDDDNTVLAAIGSLAQTLQWSREAKAREAAECDAIRLLVVDAPNEASHADLITALLAANGKLRADHQSEIAAANEALKVERTARAQALVDPLIKAGKVKIHARDASIEKLVVAANEAAFETALRELQTTPSKLRTTPALTAGLAAKGKITAMAANEQTSRQTQRTQLVQQCLTQLTQGRAAKTGDQERAWNMASRQQPDLFTH